MQTNGKQQGKVWTHMASLHVIYASTSGHTEYVIDTVLAYLQKHAPIVATHKLRAELAKPDDLLGGDIVVLASSTWNTGSIEGQLNPHMHAYLRERAASQDLGKKNVALIALGDERYHFTAAAMGHLQEYVHAHNGRILEPTLTIMNEPYGQEKKVEEWAAELAKHLS